MPLSLESRRVGDIALVTCTGRIVEGAESAALHKLLDDLVSANPYIVLHLGSVDFIDSSGLGLLVRFLRRTQNLQGNLEVCAVSPQIAEVLRITKLNTVFQPHESEAHAIGKFYEAATPATASTLRAEILCVDKSSDVLAYVRELLRQSGYEAITSDNLPDAAMLLAATRPKVVILGPELRSARHSQAAEKFNRYADLASVIELPAGFSTGGAGEAGQELLNQLHAILSGAGRAATLP